MVGWVLLWFTWLFLLFVLQSDAAAGLADACMHACMALVDDYSQVTRTHARARTTCSDVTDVRLGVVSLCRRPEELQP